MKDASPDSARYEDVADEKSPDGLLLEFLILSFCVIPVTDDTQNSGLKCFVENVLNLIHFVLSDQPFKILF